MEWEKIAGNKRRLTVKLGFTSLKPILQLCRRHTDCFYLSIRRQCIENQIIYATISSRRIFLFAYLDVAFLSFAGAKLSFARTQPLFAGTKP
ncbi:hypothetical protein [Alloprevotella tannerae]